jgi:8-oxo-dGTP pyrophosphatase MutT (NUDIX family)
MELVFSDQPLPSTVTKSVFLAGPSPRSLDEDDWRHAAVIELTRQNFDGTVFIPVPSYRFLYNITDKGTTGWSYDDQIAWECQARERADIIAFWVPRVIDRSKEDLGMPAFTTNFELGEDLHTNKVAYGRPATATKCRYLDERVKEIGQSVHESMEALFADVIKRLGDGAYRVGGETQVPLFIWRTPTFQNWLACQKAVGNRLDGAKVVSCYIARGGFVFTYQMKVNVWVEAEQRHKSNEIIFARPDVSAVVACHKDASGVLRIALVREFRSTVANDIGFVFELPGGSSPKPGMDPALNASEELSEEAGLHIADITRFQFVGVRQLVATLSLHRVHVYAVQLNDEEFAQLQATATSGEAFGLAETSERTYVEIASLDALYALPVDYSTLGMVSEALRVLKVA